MSTSELFLRLTIAALAGAALGLEREIGRARNAGFRTHALVALGSCLFSLAGAYGFEDVVSSANVDPARVAAQVASGIGFLGAGAILRDGASVRGLTTAATLWIAAALGLSAAAGQVAIIVFAVLLVIVLLTLLRFTRFVTSKYRGGPTGLLEVEYEMGSGTLGPLLRAVDSYKFRFRSIRVDDEVLDGGDAVVDMRRVQIGIGRAGESAIASLIEQIRQRPEVRSAKFSIFE